MSEDNNSHENASVSRTDEDQNGPPSRRARDGIRGRFGGISRRQFLGVTAGSVAFTGSVSAQESEEFTEDDAKEYWEEVKKANWGDEATQLNEYHERFPDRRGEGVNIAVIDSGFDTDHDLFNPVEQEEDHLDYHINVDMENSECFNLTNSSCGEIHDTDGHGTAVTGVIWQAVPNATYTIIRNVGNIGNTDDYFEGVERFIDFYVEPINYARNVVSADIINISIGGHIFFDLAEIIERYSDISLSDGIWGRFPFSLPLLSEPLNEIHNAYNTAAQTAVVVASSGQEDRIKNQPAPFPLPPSTADDVLSVSSIEKYGGSRPNSFEIYEGGSPDYPRNGKPDVAAPGRDISSIIDNPDPSTDSWSGSSFASPHVAGIAALLSDYGEPDESRGAILNSTWPVLNDSRDLSGEGAVKIMGAYNRLLYSTLTVDVVNNITETPVAGATVTVNGEQKETDDGGEAYFDLEDGTYTVTVAYEGFEDLEEEVTIEGEDQRVLMAFDEEDEIDDSEEDDGSEDEEEEDEDTKTVWVPDPDSDSCSQMTVPADAHPDPAFETEEACLEYNGGFGGGNEDTAEETPSEDDADDAGPGENEQDEG